MLIENPEALKQWLTGYLPPICDADPQVLAKYCLALLRKDKNEVELRSSMIEQLDVFLKSKAECFVDKLLQVTHSRSYLTKAIVAAETDALSTPPNSAKADVLPDSTTAAFNITKVDGDVKDSIINSDPSNISLPSSLPPLPPLPPPINAPPYPPPETTPPYPPKKEKDEVSSSVKMRKSDTDRDEKRIRRKDRSNSRGRSRSCEKLAQKDRDRTQRSRSRGRVNRSKFEEKRKRSPRPTKRFQHSLSRSRSRSPRWSSRSPIGRRSKSQEIRSHSRNRSPFRKRSLSPRRSSSPNYRTLLSLSRSPSPKKSRHMRRKSHSPIHISHLEESPDRKSLRDCDDSPLSLSPDDSPRSLCSSPLAHIASVVTVASDSAGRFSSRSKNTIRCRDYDEQGFCMRGDQCPFDHGSDPVVLEGGAALEFPPPIAHSHFNTNHREMHHSENHRRLAPPNMLIPPPQIRNHYSEYNPVNPGLWRHEQGMLNSGHNIPPPRRFAGPPPPIPGAGRELINVPVDPDPKNLSPLLAQRLGPVSQTAQTTNPKPTKFFPNTPNESKTIQLSKIPPNLNTISHLNQHFARFGSITNIQVCYGGSSDSALITFATQSQANSAFRSPEAVLNNRFIRVFWHGGLKKADEATNIPAKAYIPKPADFKWSGAKEPNPVETVPIVKTHVVKTIYKKVPPKPTPLEIASTESEPVEGKVSKDAEVPDEDAESISVATEQSSKQQLSLIDLKKQEIVVIRKQQELLKAQIAMQNKNEKKKQEAIKLKSEVEQRTKILLEKQMQQVKVLIAKLEANKSMMKPEEIKSLFSTIKSLQVAVETTKAQLATSVKASVGPPQFKKSQMSKVVKNPESELSEAVANSSTSLPEGEDNTFFYKLAQHSKSQSVAKVSAASAIVRNPGAALADSLRASENYQWSIGVRGRGRGRGGSVYTAFDRRTTSINASGFEREDKDDVLSHFMNFGAISNYIWDKLTPSISITYSKRKEAEKAMTEGRFLGDRLLTLTWSIEPLSPTPSSNPPIFPEASKIVGDESAMPSSDSTSAVSIIAIPGDAVTSDDISDKIIPIVEIEPKQNGEGKIIEDIDADDVNTFIYEDGTSNDAL